MFRVAFRFGINQIKNNCVKTQKYLAETRNLFYNNVRFLPGRVYDSKSFGGKVLTAASFFTWLGFDKRENVEDEIVLNIKRSILLIQKKEYAKAEQMLHLCLRLAQQTINEQAVTYIYDVMANLALECNQLDKAQKLFVTVMQRLFAKGLPENDKRNIHISLKLAHICHLKGDLEKANIGFIWSISHLEKDLHDSDDNRLLMGLAKDWYGHLLYDQKLYKESLLALSEAFNILINFSEENPHQMIVLLNDMSSAAEKLGDYNKAEELLKEAVQLGKDTPNMPFIGTVHVNLGRLYMRRGLYDSARKSCGFGLRLGKERKCQDSVNEANDCLLELSKHV